MGVCVKLLNVWGLFKPFCGKYRKISLYHKFVAIPENEKKKHVIKKIEDKLIIERNQKREEQLTKKRRQF